jgi:rRNA small subunit pseudouridine methyltransferase Nep1
VKRPRDDEAPGGGGTACFKCGQEGHFSRECPNQPDRVPRTPRTARGEDEGPLPHHADDGRKSVVIILAKAGLVLGSLGLVDAYDRGITTELTNESLADVRPDIVHQCLLAIFDSDLAFRGHVKVYIETIRGKTIQVSSRLRPPRTFNRFKGLMETLFRDGKIVTETGEVLMGFLRGSVAPIIPFGAEVIALCNERTSPVKRPMVLGTECVEQPVPDSLQGGTKNSYGFFCIPCNDTGNIGGIPLVSDTLCLSPYPMAPHIMCSRLCEGFMGAIEKTWATPSGQ